MAKLYDNSSGILAMWIYIEPNSVLVGGCSYFSSCHNSKCAYIKIMLLLLTLVHFS